MSRDISLDMINGVMSCFGIIILCLGVWGVPIMYDSLDFNQKLCKHFNDCYMDFEVKQDEIENPLVWGFLIGIPLLGVFLLYLGLTCIYNSKSFESQKNKN